MAKTDVWMPLYIGDYMADTMHLTTEQHGAYLLLIMAYWRKGGALSNNDTALASIARMSSDAWSNARAVLEDFFDTSSSNAWVHPRIEKEMLNAGDKKVKAGEKARKAAAARWNNASSIAPSNAHAMLKECPSPSPSPSQELLKSADASAKQKRSELISAKTIREEMPELEDRTITDYLAVRKAKRAPMTRTAWDSIKQQILITQQRFGIPPNQALCIAVQRNWAGFEADWVGNHLGVNGNAENQRSFGKATINHDDTSWGDNLDAALDIG